MADDQADVARDRDIEPPDPEEEEEEQGAARGFAFPLVRYLRVIAIGLGVLIIAAVGGYLVVNRALNPPIPPSFELEVTTRDPLAGYELDQFRTNLADRDITAYIQADLVLAYDSNLRSNARLQEELNDRQNEIRDLVNLVLNSRTSEELISVDGKEALKQEVMEKINSILSDGRVERVYLKNFVVQTL